VFYRASDFTAIRDTNTDLKERLVAAQSALADRTKQLEIARAQVAEDERRGRENLESHLRVAKQRDDALANLSATQQSASNTMGSQVAWIMELEAQVKRLQVESSNHAADAETARRQRDNAEVRGEAWDGLMRELMEMTEGPSPLYLPQEISRRIQYMLTFCKTPDATYRKVAP
jgi:chromosome segregation ATPase